jgi:hypothetical protein
MLRALRSCCAAFLILVSGVCFPHHVDTSAQLPARIRVHFSVLDTAKTNPLQYAISLDDADSARVLTRKDFAFPGQYSRWYGLATRGQLRLRVALHRETPMLRGEGTATFTLRPDMYLDVLVSIIPVTPYPELYRCMGCTGRAAFPLETRPPSQDSLVIDWQWGMISRPSPIAD